MSSTEIHQSKQDLRSKLHAIHSNLALRDVQNSSLIIEKMIASEIKWDKTDTIHCYISLTERHEVITTGIIRSVFSEHPDVKLYVPMVRWDDDETVCSVEYRADDRLERDKRGFLVPQIKEIADESMQYDAIIVPCLGADRNGNRIGSGRGYYDQLLSKQKYAQKIGLCLEEAIVKEVPVDDTDVKLDVIITQNQAYRGQN